MKQENTIQKIEKIISKIASPHFPFESKNIYTEEDKIEDYFTDPRDDNKTKLDYIYNIEFSEKVKAIKEVLNQIGLDYIVDYRYGIVVSSNFDKTLKNNKTIKKKLEDVDLLLISHIDTIFPFFVEETLDNFKNLFSEFSKNSESNEIIRGPLDNLITNAILLSLLEMRIKNHCDNFNDVMIVFSIGEEMKSERTFNESNGIKEFMKKFENHFKSNFKVINLDVTAREYHDLKEDKDVAGFIEYDDFMYDEKFDKDDDFSPLRILKDIETLDSIRYCDYGEYGTYDDLCNVTKNDVFGFTFGLNIYGIVHSLNSYTTVKNINDYFSQLNKFVENKFFRPNLKVENR